MKILKISSLIILSLIILLTVLGWVFQDKITNLAIDQISDTVGAPMTMKKVRFSLVRRFPLASIEIQELWLGAPESGDSTKQESTDTLAVIDKMFLSLNTRALFSNVIKVRKVEVMNGHFNYLVDENGLSNIDFLLASDSTDVVVEDSTKVEEDLDISLEKLVLQNISCLYKDETLKAKAKVLIPNITASARLDNTTMMVGTKGKIKLMDVSYEDGEKYQFSDSNLGFDLQYVDDGTSAIDVKGMLQFDDILYEGAEAFALKKVSVNYNLLMNDKAVTVKELNVNADDLRVDVNGDIVLEEEMELDLSVSIEMNDLAKFSNSIPSSILKEYEISQISGAFMLDTKLKGKVTDNSIPHFDTDFSFTGGALKYQNYPLIKNITLLGSANNGLENNNTTTSILLNQFSADFSGNHLNIEGFFQNLDHLNYDLKTDLNINLLTSKSLISDPAINDISGNMQVHLTTQGVLPQNFDDAFVHHALKKTKLNVQFKNVDLDLDSMVVIQGMSAQMDYQNHKFDLEELNLYLPEYDLRVVDNSLNASFKGNVMKPETLEIDLSEFHVGTLESSINGNATIKNMEQISFDLHTDLDIDLAHAQQFVEDSILNSMKGHFLAVLDSKGSIHLDSIEAQMEDILYDQTSIEIKMKDINLDMKDTLMNVNDLNGHILVKDDVVNVGGLGGSYLGMKFNIDTTIVKNLFNTALRNKPGKLEVEGVYSFGDLDYSILGALGGTEDPDSSTMDIEESEAETETLWTYEIKGKFHLNSLKYENSLIEDISALYNVNDTVVIVDQLKFEAFRGKGNTSMKILLKPDDLMLVQMKADIDHMDIRNMLEEMNNFDQEEFTYENMSGVVTTDNFYLQLKMIGDSIVYPDMRMSTDLKFEDGGIYHYPVVQDMAQYLPSIDNLDTLAFKTIASDVFVIKNGIYFPETLVVTNAFDVHALGMQTFGENYQYHIGVKFSEIAFGKSKKKEKEQAQMGDDVVAVRRNFRWLRSTGKDGKYKNVKELKDDERTIMRDKVRTQQRLLKLRFFPKQFKFETGVEQ
ncbi:MAG: hypothetical protein JXR07_14100 [Reichenbachiella sp.]